MIWISLLATLIVVFSQHVVGKAKKKVRVRLHFEYQEYASNEYEIVVDGKLLQKVQLKESDDPFTSYEDTAIEFEEGSHGIRIMSGGKQAYLGKTFSENEAYKVIFDTEIHLEPFSFDQKIGY